jgi:uncharacterized membrane protein
VAQGTLTVWRFETAEGADAATHTLEDLSRQGFLTVVDAATVSWPAGRKKPRTHQYTPTTSVGALGGSFWGMLFGLIFFVPLLGAAVGAASGALVASLTDVGIDDAFITEVRDQVTEGTSALFVLTHDAVLEKVRDAFAAHGPSELIHTNLSAEQESALREVFQET